MKTKEWLLARIIKDDNGCWNFTGSKGSRGYGRVVNSDTRERAHRLSYRLFVGDIPDGLCICHRCDNPSCINPDHLFPATHQENMRDKASKLRSTIGETNSHAKLKEAEVFEIRRLFKTGLLTKTFISKMFRVHPNTVIQIINGARWSYLPKESEG